jgi:hypothetical protein
MSSSVLIQKEGCIMNRIAIWTLAALSSSTTASRAEFIVNFEQSGGNVVAAGRGTINLRALSLYGVINEEPGVHGEFGYAWLGVWPSGGYSIEPFYLGPTGPHSFGPSGDVEVNASSAIGDLIGIYGDVPIYGRGVFSAVVVPNGYVSGTLLSNTTTWDNTTISGLGLTPGTYTWTWGSGPTADSFVVQIGSPEPSTMIVLGAMAGAVVFGAWIRGRPRAATAA